MRKRGKSFARRLDPLAAFRAADRQHALDESQQIDLTLAVRAAALAMRSGAGTEHHTWTLASGINVALILCERGIGKDHEPDVISGQIALMRTIERGNRTGRWGFDGPALAEVDTALAVYEAQLAGISRQEAVDAVREVERRVAQGHVFRVEGNT